MIIAGGQADKQNPADRLDPRTQPDAIPVSLMANMAPKSQNETGTGPSMFFTPAWVFSMFYEKGIICMNRPLLLFLLAAMPCVGQAQTFANGATAFANRDFTTAISEWVPLAENGDSQAQLSLGEMYLSGTGVPQDFDIALGYLRSAAGNGNAAAQFNLGVMYGRGDGVVQDHREAARWYLQSAAQGNPHAQNNLGALYSTGIGVTRNLLLAARFFEDAARQGEENAQNSLGKMLAEHLGTDRHEVRAYMWFSIAAAGGSDEAAENIAAIAARMTPEQITQATQLAVECLQSGFTTCDSPPKADKVKP